MALCNDHANTPLYDLWLTGIRGIGPITQHELLSTFKDPETIYNASEGELENAGISENRRKRILGARDLEDAERRLDSCIKHGIFFITIRDSCYPEELKTRTDLPVLLYGKGDPENMISTPKDRIAIIGARRCSAEDKKKCISLVGQMSGKSPGVIIISGGAKGIDGYAHTAAIRNHLRTIAFVGTGLDICYPREHSELLEKICEHGAILSEYPPGTPAKPYHFPQRNRLIAAWSGEMHIIGAGRNSGTRTTQQYFEKYHGVSECFLYDSNIGTPIKH